MGERLVDGHEELLELVLAEGSHLAEANLSNMALKLSRPMLVTYPQRRASFGVFKDKAGADVSVRLAADYVREHLSKLFTEKPEIIEGPIKAHD